MPRFFSFDATYVHSRVASAEPEDAADATMSAETCEEELSVDSFSDFVTADFQGFLQALRWLPGHAQDLLLAYHLLNVKQSDLGTIFDANQSRIGHKLRRSVAILSAHLRWPNGPAMEDIRRALTTVGIEPVTVIPRMRAANAIINGRLVRVPREPWVGLTEDVVALFIELGDFDATALQLGLCHRATVHKLLSRIEYQLLGSVGAEGDYSRIIGTIDADTFALGWYLASRLDGKKSVKHGSTGPDLIRRKDPACVGEFRIDLQDPGFASMFRSDGNGMARLAKG